MADTYATPEDVRKRWLSTDPLPDDQIIQEWLDDAEIIIFAEVPHLADKITEDPDGEWHRRVVVVEVQLVSQAMKNPDGVRQRSQTAGVFTDSSTFGTETISQAMQITPAHRAILTEGTKKNFGLDMTPKRPGPHPFEHAWINGPGDEHLPGRS